MLDNSSLGTIMLDLYFLQSEDTKTIQQNCITQSLYYVGKGIRS